MMDDQTICSKKLCESFVESCFNQPLFRKIPNPLQELEVYQDLFQNAAKTFGSNATHKDKVAVMHLHLFAFNRFDLYAVISHA